ncbi:MAG: DUF736 domain-containing protein [Spirochaetaceae bacterium]|nr:DUF736 domain-containing protein [Spirochaetaceae bacterium]
MSMKIGAMWVKETKEGKKYISGIIEYPGMNLSFAAFKNEDKEKESHPDYNIIWSPERKESKNESSNGARDPW